ncbi:MAG: DeoR/GlpR family DNA-binding transcription regulator [Candidatus Izemoplasmatales bacterium]|jgi:DeoR/GlpR family transcriptional regulator of sugar metabolism
MISNNRQLEILELLTQKGNVTVEELAEKFAVSKMTIRRDLEKLQENNLLQRTHGGALMNRVLLQEMAYNEKREEHADIKQCITRKALSYLENNKIIYLDAGTTTFELAQKLPTQDLTVITNDIRIAAHLMLTSNNVVFLGGMIEKETGSVTDGNAQDALQGFNIDIAFLGTSSVDNEMNLCTPDINRMKLKKVAFDVSTKTVLLVDSSKFYSKSLYKILNINDLDVVISDFDSRDLGDFDLKSTEFITIKCKKKED